jgi:transposase InsO family protein
VRPRKILLISGLARHAFFTIGLQIFSHRHYAIAGPCSIRTMYRILTAEHGGVKERHKHVQQPHYEKPELLTTASNQICSWDIKKLKGPAKWTYFYLYMILDIFSRYVVGWMVAHREQSARAKRLIEETCMKQNIESGQLALHADRGSSILHFVWRISMKPLRS